MPRLTASPKRTLDADTLPEYLEHYLADKAAVDAMVRRVEGMKATLMEYLDENGVENERGHKTIVVDGVATITRQRKIHEDFLEPIAERWLAKKGKRDEVIKEVTIEEFDMDAFMALLFDDKTPQSTVDTFYERSPRYSFHVTGRQ